MIFYEGPSMLDGKPIVAIATTGSKNRKTGDMIQTWILRSRIDPVRALAIGADKSICGDCKHCGSSDRSRTCYVNVCQAPLSVYRAYRRGSYRKGTLAELPDQPLRMGAYGDPVAVPWHAWTGLHDRKLWTGYTHQWRHLAARPFRNVLMASCDGPVDAADAARDGWRAFLVTPVGQAGTGTQCPSDSHGIQCPSDSHGTQCPSDSHGTQCTQCGLCSGLQRPTAPPIWIAAHGTSKAFVTV